MISRRKRKEMQDNELRKAKEQQKAVHEMVQKTEKIQYDFLQLYENILVKRGRAN